MTAVSRPSSRYPAGNTGIGIVHLGLGAFHRAHQAAYLDSVLERHGGGDWGIAAANLRSNARLVEQLEAQDCRYHLAEWTSREQVRLRAIGSIRRALFAGTDPQALLELMSAATTRIVSLTVTEKAYFLEPSTGTLLEDAPEIAHDLKHPAAPRTAPGIIVEALRRRRAAGLAPFTVLCCDNMPANGRRARDAVCALAALGSPGLAAWIEQETAFPSCMVDRIVPAVTPAELERLARLIGACDPAAVSCEAFSQWVIEDRFPLGRPDWQADGVEMVGDVAPWETMKLRLLNGAHSLMAYTGLAAGCETVAEAFAAPSLRRLVRAWFAEAAASLAPVHGRDPAAYAATLERRFANDALDHRLSQIAMDGSQKIPARWLEGAMVNLEQGSSVPVTARAVAAWMSYVRGSDNRGRRWHVDDPMASRLAACHRDQSSAAGIVDAFLAIGEIFPPVLAARGDFRAAVIDAFVAIDAETRHG